MFKVFKYRLLPNRTQERELQVTLETHRRLYNEALDGRMLCWDSAGVNWNYFSQTKWFTIKRRQNPWYANLNVSSAQQTLRTLEKAYKAFFKRGGFPRFKGIGRFRSFAYDMSSNGGGCKIVGSKLRLQNIGTVRVKWHREIPEDGRLKQARILQEDGKWFVCFAVDFPAPEPLDDGSIVGIDVGINSFVTTSEGEILGDSKILRRTKAELRRRQRSLSRCRKGSCRRRSRKKSVAKLHARVRNARRDMHHKVARSLVYRNSVIAVENLNIKGMLRNHRLAGSIADAGWAQFLQILTGKAESAGRRVIKVNPRGTSQECSRCNQVVKKSLGVRIHRCDCGLVLDRDVNAARNILARALPDVDKLEVALA